jgi:hypothetical protein
MEMAPGVMLDHAVEEELSGFSAGCVLQSVHLSVVHHAVVAMVHPAGVRVLAPSDEPAGHLVDLRALRSLDLPR